MRRIIVMALCAALSLAACGGGDDEFTEENLADELVEAELFEREAADCVAASVFDDLSDDEVDDIQGASFEEGDIPESLQVALTDAVAACL